MASARQHFVLVHGAGNGAWCWVKIAPLLEKAGHRVTTVELASAGEDASVLPDDVLSLAQYTQPLQDLFASFPDDQKVILVGHSMGGLSISRICEIFPKRVSVAVYLAGFMPAPGSSTFNLLANEPDLFPKIDYKLHFSIEGGPPTSLEFTPAVIKDYYYNACSAEDVEYAMKRTKRAPSPAGLLAPHPFTKGNYGSVRKVYVLGLDDKAMPPAVVHKLLALHPPQEVHEIGGDHSLFFSAVKAVEKILNDSAAKYGV